MILEFERAHGMRDALDGIRLPVGVVVHRINAPLVSRAVMFGVQDAVHHRITHVQVRRSHVDLRPQNSCTVRELARPHPFKQIQVFFHRPVAIRTVLAGLGQRAPVLAYFVC